jgi:uncharacterized RmlC-like cupin family protein
MSQSQNDPYNYGLTLVAPRDSGNDDYGEPALAEDATSMPETSTCRMVHPARKQLGKQGLAYFVGLSAESVGSRGICMHLQTIPPGGKANAHLHANHETAIYVLSGAAEMWYGEDLHEHLVVRTGDFLYIPAGMPHLPANLSPTEPCTAIIARTDPNEQESVVLLPELDLPTTA